MEASAPIPAVNRSSVLEFVLLGVTDRRGLQLLLFGVLLVTYTLTLLGNLLIMILYFTLGAVETLLLAVMSTDRFLAICRPLHYPALMTPRVCSSLVLACWAASLLFLPGLFAWMLSLPFCGPRVLNHFFCDSSPLLELVCADTRLLQLVAFLVAVCTLLLATLITALSYGFIISTILRLPAAGARSKTFSTCSSHILVVSMSYGSCIIMYLNPTQTGRLNLNKGLAFFNTTVSPLLNPFIYCLRNQLVHRVCRDLLLRGRELSSKIFRA
ncbi:Olfactory receptor 6C76 [Lemmus lemmus]